MKIVRSIAEMREARGTDIALVPTMGAFHSGHLSLMRKARELAGQVVVSLFVNPLQFGPNEDFKRYPRDEEADAEMARQVGVDILFMPPVEEMYSPNPTTIVSVPSVTENWEGASRPRHFEGVATVVLKLFNIVQPRIAVFGQKDLQQCITLEKRVRDLNLPIELRIEPTEREADGLALSSRNRYLSPAERDIAPTIYRSLERCVEDLRRGGDLGIAITAAKDRIFQSGIEIQYLAYVSRFDLKELENYTENSALIFAGKLGTTRLIDNVIVG